MHKPSERPRPRGRPPKFTREQLEHALIEAKFVVKDAAERLQVAESTAHRAIERYGIEVGRVLKTL